MYSNTKLERAKKRKVAEIEEEKTGNDEMTTEESSHREPLFFFCDTPDSPLNLHAASTLEVDRKVRNVPFF